MRDVVLATPVILIAQVFVLSVTHKVRNWRSFEHTISQLGNQLAPYRRWIASSIATAELAVPVLLLWPPLRNWGLGLAGFLLTGFAIVLVVGMRKEQPVPYNCLGSAAPMGASQLIRNGILLGLITLYVVAGGTQFEMVWTEWLLATTFGTVGVIVILCIELLGRTLETPLRAGEAG